MDSNNNFYNGQDQYNGQYYQQNQEPNYQYQQPEQANMYQQAAFQLQQNMYAANGYGTPQGYQNAPVKPQIDLSKDVRYNQYGMRWYLFLIWGYLIYGIINNITTSISMFKLADAYSEIKYNDLDELAPIFVIGGLALLALAVYQYYTRKLLMAFNASAPKATIICICSPLVLIVIYILLGCMITDYEFDEMIELVASILSSSESWVVWLYLIFYGILIYGNVMYFKNRKHLFNDMNKIKLF